METTTAMDTSPGDAPATVTPARPTFAPQGMQQDNVPVYVMLPLDTVNADGVFRYATAKWFISALGELKQTGIQGVAVDVWWGAVERRPRRYDWCGYRHLFDLVASLGLRIQVVMAFHACGGNVGDNAEVPLPPWVLAAGERDPDIFFTDRPRDLSPGRRNRECISLFADEEPALLKGRSPMQCYVDFMRSFRDEFHAELGGLVEEVIVGSGPCGELRYPSYPESNGWRFPGIGEFQCYDRRALASLARAAATAGHPEWGNAGPPDAGSYNSTPEETAFFRGWEGGWDSDHGRFFLSWYSNALLEHGERMLLAASSVFNTASSAAALPLSRGSSDVTANSPASGSSGLQSLVNNNNNNNSGGNIGGQECTMPMDCANLPGTDEHGALDTTAAIGRQAGSSSSLDGMATIVSTPRSGTVYGAASPDTPPSPNGGANAGTEPGLPPVPGGAGPHRSEPTTSTGGGGGGGTGTASISGSGAPLFGLPSTRQPSYASFRSSSISEGLNLLEDWAWPTPSGPAVHLTLKIAGVHWWYRTRSHAAELAAGYYNCDDDNGNGILGRGYERIVALCARHGAALTLTCVEMCDSQHPPEALCGPEGLLRRVREYAAIAGVPVAGENALPCFMPNAVDEIALQRVVYNTQPWGTPLEQGAGRADAESFGALSPREELISTMESATPAQQQPSFTTVPLIAMTGGGGGPPTNGARLPSMRAFTFLRLTPDMMMPSYQEQWERFMKLMARNAQRFRTSPGWRKNMGFL